MIWYNDFQQGSDAWHEARKGRFGGTAAHLFLVKGKNADGIGAGLIMEAYDLVGEKLVGYEEPSYGNFATQRGTDLEPLARTAYELQTFTTVQEVGYIAHGDWFGVSPDGVVDDTGLIEIKCPLAKEFIRFAVTREIDSKHVAQMQWGMFIADRAWCDYVVFHPELGMIIERVERDADTHTIFKAKTEAVSDMMDEILERVKNVQP